MKYVLLLVLPMLLMATQAPPEKVQWLMKIDSAVTKIENGCKELLVAYSSPNAIPDVNDAVLKILTENCGLQAEKGEKETR